ncbi:hypothetical protein B0H16DRAFT_1562206 [Mycena metata]|uniref:Uncharacterized protein n=1 Tax=Mycena metata TaxID=1033252 RepID=A0AAD7IHP3_9AGAR|nr:hypothetical protein B0H16DRAFT_1562206 [Mycena metata]
MLQTAIIALAMALCLVLAGVALYHLRVSDLVPHLRAELVRPPLVGVPLAVHHALPVKKRLSQFPAPNPAELARVDTQSYASLRPPPKKGPDSYRRQFTAPGSPNAQLLERQRAHRRLPHEHPLLPSLPTTLVLPCPVTPPRSPALDLRQVAIHQSQMRLDSPHGECAPPPRSIPPYSGSPVCGSPFLFNSDPNFSARLLTGPPRSPSPRTTRPPSRVAHGRPLVRLPSSGSVAAPSLQTVSSNGPHQPIPSPQIPAHPLLPGLALPKPAARSPIHSSPPSPLLPSLPASAESASPLLSSWSRVESLSFPIRAELASSLLASPLSPVIPTPLMPVASRPQRHLHRVFSFPVLSTVPESSVVDFNPSRRTTAKKMKRRSMAFNASTPPGSPTAATENPESLSTAPPKTPAGCVEPVAGSETARVYPDSEIAEEDDHYWRIPLSDVHNTIPTTPVVDTFQPCAPPTHLAALVSPSKPQRRVARGPNPVYHYHADAPAVAIAESIVRSAQNDFMNFSVALGAKLEGKGWATDGPNELAPPVVEGKRKKKKKAGTKGIQPKPSISVAANISDSVSGIPKLLPAFHVIASTSQDIEGSSFAFRPTAFGITSAERMVSICRADCGDIYCGGCL